MSRKRKEFDEEEELYPPLEIPSSEEEEVESKAEEVAMPAPTFKRTIAVKRFGPIVEGRQICRETEGTAWLVPAELVKGKDYFTIEVDERIEKAYNWKDDLSRITPSTAEIIETANSTLLRLGVVKKEEWTPAVREKVIRSIVNLFMS